MAELFTYKFRKMPVRIVRLDNGKNYFVIRDICNILGFSNPNRILAQYTENAPLYVLDHEEKNTSRYAIITEAVQTAASAIRFLKNFEEKQNV